MYKDLIDNFIEKMIQKGRIEQTELKRCTEEEIRKLEKYYKIKLPKLYRQFLLEMGHGPVNFFGPDILWTYKYLFENKDSLIEGLYEDNIKYILSEDVFVFQESSSGIFLLFFPNLIVAQKIIPPVENLVFF